MDKAKLKSFAIESRRNLIKNISERLSILGFKEKKIDDVIDLGREVTVNGIKIERSQYNKLKESFIELGYEEFVERVAYTWFNRFVALRFMELNGYIDEAMTTSTTSKIEPDVIDNYGHSSFFGNLRDEEKNEIHNLRDAEKIEELYSKIIELKCNELNKVMPFMFEEKNNFTELLFPTGLLREKSFLVDLRVAITNDDKEEVEGEKILPVEIIGWLYQFYNSEKKDSVFADLKKNIKIKKENIPAATQLFTPKWIVKYMVENSLGKLALETLNIDENIKSNWKYYIESEIEKTEKLKIEEIKILDPAMGSGHMLVYAFDLLYQIYESLGYSAKDSVQSILNNNLFGLEIDDRAGQLATFALVMKGREKFRRLFSTMERKEIILKSLSIQESNSLSENTRDMIKDNKLTELAYLIEIYHDGKEYGSILKLRNIDFEKLEKEKEILKSKNSLFYSMYVKLLDELTLQARVMTAKYEVVVTNPPYMGNKGMSVKVDKFVKDEYPNSKSDLCTVFIEKCGDFTAKNRYTSMITMHSWMFLSSFENLRKELIEKKEIDTLVHLGTRAFEEIGGEVVQTVTWNMKNKSSTAKGKYARLVNYNNADWKEKEFFKEKNRYSSNQKDFEKIPGSPIAYWVSDKVKEIFEKGIALEKFAEVRKGMDTGNNEIFMRGWTEINLINLGIGLNNGEETKLYDKKWVPYNKGGEYRKWYGNHEYVLEWKNDGEKLKKFEKSNLRSKHLYFKESLSWTLLSSSNFGLRYYPKGFIFDSNGSSIVFNDKQKNDMKYIEALLLTKISFEILQILSSTMAFNIGDLAKFPVIESKNNEIKSKIEKNTNRNIDISKQEWNSRETSWDFESSPLLNHSSISSAFNSYSTYWTEQFFQMHRNEEELNRLFIEIYGLEDEMDEKVELKDITLLKKETSITEDGKLEFSKSEITKQFISYCIGVIMGRYSLDKPGLIMANSEDKLVVTGDGGYQVLGGDGEVRHSISSSKYIPDDDAIIPIIADTFAFEDSIAKRFEEVVIAIYGVETLEENLDFIADALDRKKDETARETISKYFMNDFMKDHLQRYQKRPIYWLFTSGKTKGFNALVYMHRYNPMSVAKLRQDYLLKYQERLESRIKSAHQELETETNAKDKNNIEKKVKELQAQFDEIKKYDEEVKHMAEDKLAIDLDDGVKVNYAKFGGLLYKI